MGAGFTKAGRESGASPVLRVGHIGSDLDATAGLPLPLKEVPKDNVETQSQDQPQSDLPGSPEPARSEAFLDSLQVLRKAGVRKPDGVSWSDWMGPRRLSHRHELIAVYAAGGMSVTAIAQSLGMNLARVGIILKTTRMQARLAELRQHYYGNTIQDEFKARVPKALSALDKVLDNPAAKDTDALKAADQVFNRALGKPKETIEIRSSTAKDIFEYLDRKKAERERNFLATDASLPQNSQQSSEKPTIETTARELPPAEASVDETMSSEVAEFDDWTAKNLAPLTKKGKD